MSERRSWTQDEDRVLKYLKDAVQVKKWSQISRIMESEYHIPGRNGKQCRERYHNHLDSSIVSKQLTLEQEEKLFQLHNRIGNRWSIISKEFPGRTDNQIKNHFHSKLRKAVRKLNKEVKRNFKKTAKIYPLSLIYKIVQASDYRFNSSLICSKDNCQFFNGLKNSLLEYVDGGVQKSRLQEMSQMDQASQLISQLKAFDFFFKNKKNGVLQCQNIKQSSSGIKTKIQSDIKISNLTSNSDSDSQICLKPNSGRDKTHRNSFSSQISHGCIEEINRLATLNSPKEEAQLQENESLEEANQNKMEIYQKNSKKNYSFSNNGNMLNQKAVKQGKLIIDKLVQEQDFDDQKEGKAMSVRSYESMRFYEDSFIGESEVNMMMKRFDSFSNLQEGLFE